MKKILSILLIVLLSLSLLTACGKESGDTEKIVIGVSPDPHAKIVAQVVEDLKEDGIELVIKEFTDYVTPNTTLDDGDLDANYFQHIPYLEDFVEKEGVNLVHLDGVHIEPMALYSSKVDSLDALEEGAEIAIPNDSTNGGRALLLLQDHGLIKLDEAAGILATERDITENPKNLKFTALEAALIPRALDDVDAAVINTNYALEADLNPTEDGIIVEDANSPYINVIAVRKGEENQDKFKKLIRALQSEKVRKFIEEEYKGAIVPAF